MPFIMVSHEMVCCISCGSYNDTNQLSSNYNITLYVHLSGMNTFLYIKSRHERWKVPSGRERPW